MAYALKRVPQYYRLLIKGLVALDDDFKFNT
jgi:hypothetical protein